MPPRTVKVNVIANIREACSRQVRVAGSNAARLGLATCVTAGLLAGCSTPAGRINSLADRFGFDREQLRAERFDLVVYRNDAFAADASGNDTLHVYLEGDGQPWKWKVLVMPDPTPRRPLMLELMTLDQAPSVYIGRPCYNGLSRDEGCTSALWTSARYSEAVVASMARAIEQLATGRGVDSVRLFGHSGGGTLAMLLADRLPDTRDVVTLGGNLDPDAWTDHHGYLALNESLNPARRPALARSVRQWHLIGGADRVVPPAVVRPFLAELSNAIVVDYPTFTHGCCWGRIWSGVLSAVVENSPARLPTPQARRAVAAEP